MHRIVLILVAILGLSGSACAINNPVYSNRCSAGETNSGTILAARSCVLNSVTSGNTVVIHASYLATSGAVTSTGGETVVCPAGAVGNTTSFFTRICYIVLGASHATLTITLTATGGAAEAAAIMAIEGQGIGAVDAGSASGAAAHSMSTTTAGSNEIVFLSCRAFANEISPGTGFSQINTTNVSTVGGQDERTTAAAQIVSVASTITSACTFTNDTASTVIAALAFSISGAPAPAAVQQLQACSVNTVGIGNGIPGCRLYNTVSGNKIVAGILLSSATGVFTVSASCTEACTCPANAQTTAHLYGATDDYVLAICYADTTSNHAFFSVNGLFTGVPVSTTRIVWVEEISGMNTGADASSSGNAIATTVNYTTSFNNEYTVCFGADNNGNPMSPGNSFLQLGQVESTIIDLQQGLFMGKTTVSSGSNTCSFSLTGSTQPLIAVLSFTVTATGMLTPNHAVIIDFRPRQPWIDRRSKLKVITI